NRDRAGKSGFGIVESIVAALIGAFLLMALVYSVTDLMKSSKAVESDQDFIELVSKVRMTLSSAVSCTESVARSGALATAKIAGAPAVNGKSLEIYALGNDAPASSAQALLKANDKVGDMTVESIAFVGDPIPSGRGYIATLRVV